MRAPHEILVALVAGVTVVCSVSGAAETDSIQAPVFPQPSVQVYKTVGDSSLRAHVFLPQDAKPGLNRPGIAVFHGGGWAEGQPEWCYSQCRYFAWRGMVAVAVQYRLVGQGEVTPLECMADARSAIRWMRQKAKDLGLDPERIAAAGWSAGGQLAACAAMVQKFEEPDEDRSVSSSPNALLLWFPAVHLEQDTWFGKILKGRATAAECSPALNVKVGLPPTIVFQGTADDVTPLSGAKVFAERMRAARNRCDLHVYEGRGHLFTRDLDDGIDAMVKADAFLVSLGFLKGEGDVGAIKAARTQK